MKKISFLVILVLILGSYKLLFAQETSQTPSQPNNLIRIKDVGKILEMRDNQLLGFGLVVGLRNTGDSRNTTFTKKALTNLLKKMGISPDENEFRSRNVASVMVTANLPSYAKKGQRLSVSVSSLGDATSLSGGTLLMTSLKGADLETYAVAQGTVVIGGVSGSSSRGTYVKNQTTSGLVNNGAIVEREVPVTWQDYQNVIITLNQPNFVSAANAAAALQEEGYEGAKAIDANTIKVPLENANGKTLVEVIAEVENVRFKPDGSSKVVVNSRTGTVVIGQNVRLFPVAVTHGNISVQIDDNYNDPSAILITSALGSGDGVKINEPSSVVHYLEPAPTLSSLVDALNELGVSSKDLISIIQALKESGALIANLEII